MSDNEKCPCESVKQLRRDTDEKFKDAFNRIRNLEAGQNNLNIKFATIDAKLNMIIGGVTILAVAVAAVVIPMIF